MDVNGGAPHEYGHFLFDFAGFYFDVCPFVLELFGHVDRAPLLSFVIDNPPTTRSNVLKDNFSFDGHAFFNSKCTVLRGKSLDNLDEWVGLDDEMPLQLPFSFSPLEESSAIFSILFLRVLSVLARDRKSVV